MNMDFRSQAQPLGISIDISEIMRRVYLWMLGGLSITALVAFGIAQSGLWATIATNPLLLIVVIIAQFGLVIAITARIEKMSPATAGWLFAAYSALMGVTMSFIFLVYTGADIAIAFVATAAMFGAMSIVGYTTKVDLSKVGSILFMALIGLIIASVINIFFFSDTLYWIINYAGVLIFTGLTAWDTQKIKRMASEVSVRDAGEVEVAVGRLAVVGALILYLDFINLFLFILRIVGRGGRD